MDLHQQRCQLIDEFSQKGESDFSQIIYLMASRIVKQQEENERLRAENERLQAALKEAMEWDWSEPETIPESVRVQCGYKGD